MKSKEQLLQFYNEIINNINTYSDRLVNAMCDGNTCEERFCNEEIQNLEYRKDVLEWVLN